jgi:hypothetical protein
MHSYIADTGTFSLLMDSLPLVFMLFVFVNTSYGAKRLHYEKEYNAIFCDYMGGRREYSLSDRGRVDCVTASEAIELDFSDKWAEGIGQALYYAIMTNKSPAVALIIENHKAGGYHIARAIRVCRKYNVTLYIITGFGAQYIKKIN